MAATLSNLLTHCTRSARRDAAPDGELLRRVGRTRDSEALAELVRRHATLVWGVCRRRLRHEADAEDAFQAVFLALVRQAPQLDADRPLSGWLHTVADRIARKAQARALKRAAAEVTADPPGTADVPAEAGTREFLATVDEAIAGLPRRLGEPVVLCCVEGHTRDEAAEMLGCSVPAVKARLERGRRLLRRALERRGIALPAAFLAIGIGASPVRAALRARTVESAFGPPSPGVAALVSTTGSFPWKFATALVAAAAIGLTAIGLGQADPPKDQPPAKGAVPPAAKKKEMRPVADRLGDPLPEAALLRLGTRRFRHPGTALALALSPDEKTVLTIGSEGLFAWDGATGKEHWSVRGRDHFETLTFSVGESQLIVLPGSQRAVTATATGFVLWDLATGKSEIRTAGPAGPAAPAGLGRRRRDGFRAVDVAKVGKTLALGSPTEIVLCDLDGKERTRIAIRPVARQNATIDNRLLPLDGFGYPHFAPDGKSLAVITSDDPEVVRLCDLDGGEVRRISLSKLYLDSAFSPDGKLLAVAERDDTVRVYETATGERKYEWPVKITRQQANENYIFTIRFSPDGRTVAAAASDKLIHLWDPATGKKLGELEGHAWYPRGLAFTKDSKTLYSTGWDGDIRRWDVAARKQLPLPQGIRGTALAAASPDGKTVIYADGDHNLRLVDAATGAERSVITIPGLDPDQVAFRADAKQMAVGGKAGTNVVVAVVDLSTRKVLKRFEWPKGNDPHASVEDLAFSPDGRRLAAITFRQSTVRVWDLTAGKDPVIFRHLEGYSLSFSPDGRTLITGGWDKMIRFWDPADGKLKKEFLAVLPDNVRRAGGRDDVRVFAVAYSPDGTRIAGADLGGRLWIWDADTMKPRAITETKDIPRYNTLAWSPDGLWVATGGAVGKVFVWDGWSGQLVWDRGKHRTNLFRVSFGKDDRTLVSGADDGLGYRWDLRPKDVPNEKPAALWPALIGADGPAAYRAFWAMLDQPDAAVAAIAEQGKAFTEKVDAVRVRKWIADLDSPRFAAREAAERELAGHLRAVVPFLRETLSKSPTEEQRARVQKLLDTWDSTRLGRTRAVSALAHLGTPAARKVLADWVAADPDGDLGKAAAAALRP
jgi:RNA polymerase sigma factor (sigma-70 family)